MLKRYLSEVADGLVPVTLFDREFAGDNMFGNNEVKELFGKEKIFSYPKPTKLIKRLIQIGSSENDIILDFFSGSATTAHATLQLNAEVNKILRDKNSLLSFKDENNNWSTMRFIFSKWTLREGWDNPNVFQIVKLRSSGSEISKLQEVGRGLRLPVDELGNRLSDEQFYLRYLIDFSEKDFAQKLVGEINSEANIPRSIKGILNKVAKSRNMKEEELFIELLQKGYVDTDKNIKEGKYETLVEEYPEFNRGLSTDKVIDLNKNKKYKIRIRQERFEEIKDLWNSINQKYYLKLDEVSEEELLEVSLNILKSDIYKREFLYIDTKRTESADDHIKIRESIDDVYVVENKIPYNEFLKRINKNTGIPIKIVHEALVLYNSEKTIPKDFFNVATLKNFIIKFQRWMEEAFLHRFSYKKVGIEPKETALTDINGNVKEYVVQGNIGMMRDEDAKVPDNFLYDSFVYDSDKERETISRSIIDEIIVFGKIPRNSIKVPLYFGGTTSPDFMYVLKKKNGEHIVNFVVETKGVDEASDKRRKEDLKIESAKVFFQRMKEDGLNIVFEEQLNDDDIVNMIRKLV